MQVQHALRKGQSITMLTLEVGQDLQLSFNQNVCNFFFALK